MGFRIRDFVFKIVLRIARLEIGATGAIAPDRSSISILAGKRVRQVALFRALTLRLLLLFLLALFAT